MSEPVSQLELSGLTSRCEYAPCGKPISQTPKAKPKRYCSPKCRVYASRERRRKAESAPAPRVEVIGPDRAGIIAEWSRKTLKVPSGPLRGKPFVLAPFQQEWLRGAMADGVMEAGLSCPRKLGKSGLLGVVFLAHLDGPLNEPQWCANVASAKGEYCKELRLAIETTAATANGGAGLPNLQVLKSPFPGHCLGANGARVNLLNAEKSTGAAVGSDLAVIDEAGELGASKRDLWDQMLTSTSGREGKFWAIGVRRRGEMFTEMAARADDPAVFWTEYAAPEGCALDDAAVWHACNPGLADGIKSLAHMQAQARAAMSIPDKQLNFRSLHLNQRVDPEQSLIVSLTDWAECCIDRESLPPRDGEMVIGFDAGGSTSMTALVGYWPVSGRVEVYAGLPAVPSLRDRGEADAIGTDYETMRDRGELRVYPGRVTPIDDFLADCAARFEDQRIASVGADQYRKAEVLQGLQDAGVCWPMVWRRQGKGPDGAADVRAFQRAIHRRRMIFADSKLMTWAIMVSRVNYDPSNGNPSLVRQNSHVRNDALQAAVIAAGLAEVGPSAPERFLV